MRRNWIRRKRERQSSLGPKRIGEERRHKEEERTKKGGKELRKGMSKQRSEGEE